jgi:Amino acid synthesis
LETVAAIGDVQCACSATLDIPLGHEDDPWSFHHFDTMAVAISGAPRPDEIGLLAVSDEGRLNSPLWSDTTLIGKSIVNNLKGEVPWVR